MGRTSNNNKVPINNNCHAVLQSGCIHSDYGE